MIIIAILLLLIGLSKLTIIILINKDIDLENNLILGDIGKISMIIALDGLLGIIASLGLMSII